LLEKGAGLDVQSNIGWTALIAASFYDWNKDVAKLLMEKGANVNLQSNTGETALYCASNGGNEAVVRMLLDHGADPEIKTDKGKTALDAAEENGYPVIANMLKEALEEKVQQALREAEKKAHDLAASRQRFLQGRSHKLRLQP
jgi:ankyrin repeat protein